MEDGEAGEIFGLPPPAQFGVATQHPQTGAGGVDQDTVAAVLWSEGQRRGGVGAEEINAGEIHSLEVVAEGQQTGPAMIHGHNMSLTMKNLGQVRGFAAPPGADF